jgi:hypothetical protein
VQAKVPSGALPAASAQPPPVPDLTLWAAYLIGYQHGVKAMQTAIPTEGPSMTVGQLRAQIARDAAA